MTVKELIAELSGCPDDAIVVTQSTRAFGQVRGANVTRVHHGLLSTDKITEHVVSGCPGCQEHKAIAPAVTLMVKEAGEGPLL